MVALRIVTQPFVFLLISRPCFLKAKPLIINVLKSREKLFFTVIFFLTIFVRLRLANAPFERDEGEYAYAGWQILRGGIPYLDFYNMKLPGVYISYALIFKLLSPSVFSARAILLIINLLSGFFIFKIGQQFRSGWLATAFFLLLSLSYEGQGAIANSEHFVVLFFIAGIYILTYKTTYTAHILAGILFSISFLMKQHAAVFVFLALFYILKNQSDYKNIKSIILKTLSFSIGYGIPLSILMIVMLQSGAYENFQFYTYDYAAAYSSWSSPNLKYISNFKFIFFDNIGLWLSFFATIYVVLKKRQEQNIWNNAGVQLLIAFGISFLSVCPGWHFRPHYFQLIYPFAALLMAYGWTHFDFKIHFSALILSKYHLLGLSLMLSVVVQCQYFFVWSPSEFIRKLYPNEFFNETRQIGRFLKENSKPTDKIGMYGNEPQIWFYAQREAASPFLYAYPFTETQPYATAMTEQYITETEQSNPEWFIYSNISKGESNKITLDRLEKWYTDFSKKYTVEGILYQKTKDEGELQWGNSPIDTSKTFLMLILRKS